MVKSLKGRVIGQGYRVRGLKGYSSSCRVMRLENFRAVESQNFTNSGKGFQDRVLAFVAFVAFVAL
jgi:hypothetical protein